MNSAGQRKSRSLEADFELLHVGDIQLTQTSASYTESAGFLSWQLGVALKTYNIDYKPVPFDIFGSEAIIESNQKALQGNIRYRYGEDHTILGSAGFKHGFNDYHSLWLDQYYLQQFSSLSDYEKADPEGINLGLGWRWEYLPANGFLQADLSFFKDEIAPGYEIDFDGLRRSRSDLDTLSLRLSTENILTPRIRTLHEVRITDTTDRQLRFNYQGSGNMALGESWIYRIQVGWTRENPTLDAWYIGSTLEYELSDSMEIYLNTRFYRDTGEIEDALFSSAAPGVASHQYGMGIRWIQDKHSLKIFAGIQETEYDPFGIGTVFFGNLYKGRRWVILQSAYSINF